MDKTLPTVKFRELRSSDQEDLIKWRNTKELKDNFREYRLIDEFHQSEWFENLHKDGKTLMYAITAQDILIGVCGWTYINWLTRRAELSIYIGLEFQNKGYGTAALHELHRIAFEELNFKSVYLNVYDFNPAKNLYPTVGYSIKGVQRWEHFHAGQYWSTIYMDMSKEEWYSFIEQNNLSHILTQPITKSPV